MYRTKVLTGIFFKFNNHGNWPFNDSYDGWWGHSTLPKLNYEESPELYRYIMDIGKNGFRRRLMRTAGV